MSKNLIITTPAELEELIESTTIRAVKACLRSLELPMSGQPEEYLRKRDAARLVGVSMSTIDNYVRQGKLKKHPFTGKSVRFKKGDVLALFGK